MQGEVPECIVLNAVSASSDEGLLVVAPNDCILHVNRKYGEIWGLEPSDLALDRASRLRSLVTTRIAGSVGAVSAAPAPVRHVHQLVDGRFIERWVTSFPEANMSVREIERVQDVTASYADTVARNGSTVAELQQALALRDVILDAVPDGLIICNEDGSITRVNTQGEAMFGYTSAELAGRSVDLLVPQHQRTGHVDMRAAYCGTPGPREMAPRRRLSAVHKNGTEFPVEISLGHLSGSGAAQILCVVRDATERRRAEEALRSTEERLRHAQKMEAVGRLAGGVAHDFNNILSVILGYAECLMEDLDVQDRARGDIAEIHLAATRAANLTNQLLAFSRRQILQPRVIDPSVIVTGMHQLLRRLIGEHIELETRLAVVGAVRIDPGQLEQVIMNLVVNARDAMPQGGKLVIDLSVDASRDGQPNIQGGTPAGRRVRLSVSDTGTGMDAETQAKVFEPFFTTKELGRGTGLGLSTVFGIIRQSDGEITVRSSPGAGTTFDIHLPIVGEEPSAPPPTPALPSRGAGERILLVEDEDALRKLICSTLDRAGYRVFEARDAVEALAIARDLAEPIQLVLTDVILPGMDGVQLAEQLRKECPGMRVVFMSGYTDEAMGDGKPGEGSDFLQKPVTSHLLAYKIRKVLDSC